MMRKLTQISALIASTAIIAGCAADGGLNLTTGSLGTVGQGAATQDVAAAPAIDPVCVELTTKIDALRKEGTPERLAKVATGKTSSATVKRSALARMTELDAANQQFQAKCSNIAAVPKPVAATTTPAVSAATAQAATTAAATAAAPKTAAKVKAAATTATNAAARAQQAAAAANAAAALTNAATAN
ncbi:MAG: hypothetical protein AAFV69_08850 [Pseudomonadota bacterium]